MSEPQSSIPQPANGSGKRRRVYLIQGLATLLVLVVTIFVARSLLQSAPSAGARPVPERQARLVETVILEPSDYQPSITGWGTLVPSRELNLSAQVSGAVEFLSPRLEPGLRVSAGEVLVELETEPYQAALTQARSTLAEAQANLELEQGQQAVARREFQLLTESLDRLQGSGDSAEASPMGEGLALRQPQLDIAKAAVSAARARLQEAQLNLERATVKAPFEAMVSSRAVALGSQVSANAAIARLVGVETWWVEVLVPSERLIWLDQPGADPVNVSLRQPGAWKPDQSRQGTLLRVLPELESEGNLARILVAINDPLGQPPQPAGAQALPPLLLGSFLRADIPGQRLSSVFVLEPGWLREGEQVWLMDQEGTLEFRPVEVLYRDEQAVVVGAGLNPGEALVTSRLSTPAEGMPLRTGDPSEPPAPEPRLEDRATGEGTADSESPEPEAAHG